MVERTGYTAISYAAFFNRTGAIQALIRHVKDVEDESRNQMADMQSEYSNDSMAVLD
jgi:hypothetical protein